MHTRLTRCPPSLSRYSPPSPGCVVSRDVRGCRLELARIHGEPRAGQMDWADGGRAASMLQILVRMLEGHEFEARLDKLEGTLSQLNGHDRYSEARS